jgi:PKD repeat protein
VVAFASLDSSDSTPSWDILLYDIQAGSGYQVTDSATDENQPDVTVDNDGLVHVVWTQTNVETSYDIYTSAFRLPTSVNHPPVIASITAPADPVMINTTLSAAANFSDLDITDTHTALWDWGDGATDQGIVDELTGSGTISGSHTYTSPGVYLVTLTVTDNHESSATAAFQYVVVYDPAGGFVTGSGWFDSPVGAYTVNPSLTGKASLVLFHATSGSHPSVAHWAGSNWRLEFQQYYI